MATTEELFPQTAFERSRWGGDRFAWVELKDCPDHLPCHLSAFVDVSAGEAETRQRADGAIQQAFVALQWEIQAAQEVPEARVGVLRVRGGAVQVLDVG